MLGFIKRGRVGEWEKGRKDFYQLILHSSFSIINSLHIPLEKYPTSDKNKN
jgi:hypothetical protein